MNFPVSFISRTAALMGEENCKALCEAMQNDTPVSIRINGAKTGLVPEDAKLIPWTTDGYYLSARPTFTFDPLFHAGSYYVQEAASMFLESALHQYVGSPVVALDLCAAPGGKSTLLRSSLPEGSLLIANEVMRNRSQILAENIVKWGNPEVIVTNNDPSDFTPLESLFDVILTDVPCSGEGMFRKDEVAVEEWSPANVGLCWERQRRILRDIWPCLKPGGLLIYSTCTFNREENEDNVAWIASELGAEVLPVETKEEWNITGNLAGYDFPVYRFLPHRTIGEGLFMAILRKNGTSDEDYDILSDYSSRKNNKKNNKKQNKKQNYMTVTNEIKSWICESEDFEFSIDGTTSVAKSQRLSSLENLLKDKGNSIRILHRGITLAENKGKDWQPHHSLAMSTSLNRETFPKAELTYEQAIAYLRKEAVTLDASVPKGYVLVTYRDTPLGFVKNIGNRANNLYPQEWRIRSGYMPDEIRTVF